MAWSSAVCDCGEQQDCVPPALCGCSPGRHPPAAADGVSGGACGQVRLTCGWSCLQQHACTQGVRSLRHQTKCPTAMFWCRYGGTMNAWGPTLLRRLAEKREVIVFDNVAQVSPATSVQPACNLSVVWETPAGLPLCRCCLPGFRSWVGRA